MLVEWKFVSSEKISKGVFIEEEFYLIKYIIIFTKSVSFKGIEYPSKYYNQ
jgi:hypothetical protein